MIRAYALFLIVALGLAGMARGAGVDDAIAAIQAAEEPAAAVRQFLDAQKDNPDDTRLLSAFVQRMVDLNVPESAGPAAQRLVELDDRAHLAWAVLSHMALQRGDLSAAVPAVRNAVDGLPDDPFVITTAAHVVALYDMRAGSLSGDVELARQVSELRDELSSDPLFAEAHGRALKLLRDAPQTDEEVQPAEEPGEPIVIYERDEPDVIILDTPSYGYPVQYGVPYYYYYPVPLLYSHFRHCYYPFPFHRPFSKFFRPFGRHGQFGHWRWQRFGHGWNRFGGHGFSRDPWRVSEFRRQSLLMSNTLPRDRFGRPPLPGTAFNEPRPGLPVRDPSLRFHDRREPQIDHRWPSGTTWRTRPDSVDRRDGDRRDGRQGDRPAPTRQARPIGRSRSNEVIRRSLDPARRRVPFTNAPPTVIQHDRRDRSGGEGEVIVVPPAPDRTAPRVVTPAEQPRSTRRLGRRAGNVSTGQPRIANPAERLSTTPRVITPGRSGRPEPSGRIQTRSNAPSRTFTGRPVGRVVMPGRSMDRGTPTRSMALGAPGRTRTVMPAPAARSAAGVGRGRSGPALTAPRAQAARQSGFAGRAMASRGMGGRGFASRSGPGRMGGGRR